MTSFTRSLFAAVAAVVVTVGVLHTLHARRLREASELRELNARLVSDLYRRAAAPAVSPSSVTAPERPVSQSRNAPEPTESARGDYRNAGRATPLATLHTFAWACDHGDAATVAKLVMFEGAGRDKANAYLAKLPATMRAQWPTVEAMAATLLVDASMHQPFPTARILDTAIVEKLGDDRVALHLPDTTKRVTTYQKTSDGWAYTIPEKMVDDYLARSAAQPAAPKQP